MIQEPDTKLNNNDLFLLTLFRSIHHINTFPFFLLLCHLYTQHVFWFDVVTILVIDINTVQSISPIGQHEKHGRET